VRKGLSHQLLRKAILKGDKEIKELLKKQKQELAESVPDLKRDL